MSKYCAEKAVGFVQEGLGGAVVIAVDHAHGIQIFLNALVQVRTSMASLLWISRTSGLEINGSRTPSLFHPRRNRCSQKSHPAYSIEDLPSVSLVVLAQSIS